MSLDDFVADIEGLRLRLGLDRLHLMGHSWGGLLAVKYALVHPSRLRSLVLVSPTAPSGDVSAPPPTIGNSPGLGLLCTGDGDGWSGCWRARAAGA